ncbi:protein spaetzle-like [Anoplophora glabripennis]|uniref:protein spaetzle-like n=1 Tax=Anoplophora glabripennis TaxID=217634 RepID=UPI000875619B|nr:protein spaetzle-like [Anoplophora glabripennis]
MKLQSSNLFLFQDTNQPKNERRLNIRSVEDEIIFPDSSEWEPEPIRRIETTPNCAVSDTFCENVEFYPYQHVKTILQDLSTRSKFFFGVDEELSDLKNRVDPDEGETFICASVQRLIFPKIARNNKNEWKYVINQDKDDGFVQGIRVESCRHHGSPCDLLEVPLGFKASCKQKYIYRRLLALNDEGNPVVDTFSLPSACCCSYKRDMDFLARLASNQVTK